jgi:hypothetical protein
MDINQDAVKSLLENVPTANMVRYENNTDLRTSTVTMPRLYRPYMPVSEGGLGLNAPCTVNGDSAQVSSLTSMPHANFWSVRKHLRPAVSVLDGSDIPGVRFDESGKVLSDNGGTMGDPVLWGQFDFPVKGRTEYTVPPAVFDEQSDKLILSTGEYLAMDDWSVIQLA